MPSSERRSEKAKSYQVPSGRAPNDHQRPLAGARTLSNTQVELRRADDIPAPLQDEALRRPLPNLDGQDEDEVAGVVGALRTFSPFSTPEVSEELPTLNIAVLGHSNVGKSTFMQRALELPTLPTSQAAERTLPVDGSDYLVRLLELPIEELDIDDDDTINWPDTIEDKMMPRVDGAIALYDVQDKGSFEELPQVLNAIANSAVPTLLLSCKCDTPQSEREIDPAEVEQTAKRVLKSITTFQVSRDPETHRRGISVLLNSIVSGITEERRRSLSANRRRALSSTLDRSRSPRKSGHSRASSELSAAQYKDQRHSRHDSSIAGYTSGDRLRVPRDDDQMQGSFLHEETASEASLTSTRSSESIDAYQAIAAAASQASLTSENGATFDELVTRLLSQPATKSDLKFSAIFLAMYRKFAAPGKLLEAIVERFDDLERNGSAQMLKSVTQLRHVSILQSWVATYPGDFAFPKTKRRLRTFVSKLAQTRIFAVAARELTTDLEAVHEDDDTNWAFCDRDREASGETARSSLSSTVSTLIDDPSFTFEQELSGSTINDDVVLEKLPKFANQMLVYVEQAQKQAQGLQPSPRAPVTKAHWRALMELPDEIIAKELTRMDWIMFSAIRPRDLVRHVSLSKEQREVCKDLAHVNRMIDHFNQLASWVANYVLYRDKPKHRALMLEKFMRIARKLRELNNYNALGAIIAGVKSTSVHRLGATRELIPQATGKDWLKLEILMAPSRSHFAYRLAWENSSTERIPYLPLHRRDLASAQEGNKTFIGNESDGRINWKKFEIMGEVIIGLQRAQGMPYRNIAGTKGNDHVKDLVLGVKLLKDEEELYERSLQCEPAASAASGPSAKLKQFFQR